MRIQRALDPVLSNPTKVRLLRSVFKAPSRSWTGRELAAAAGVSTAQAARDLRDLSDVGILRWEVVGRSFSWELNHDHVLCGALATLFRREADLRPEMLRQISTELRGLPVERARVFGSVARGEERSDSDVDLFVQLNDPTKAPEVAAALERIRERIWRGFGNPLSPVVYTTSKAKRPPNPDLMASIERDGLEVLTSES